MKLIERFTAGERSRQIAMFVTANGIAILFGQIMVFMLPDHDIPKSTVVVLCIWNFILGRLIDKPLRDDGI